MAKDAYGAKVKERVNWPITIALILLAIVVIVFPLYMTARISVSETMPTGLEIFTLPAHWDFANFLEAIKETQFFSSFLNSLLITVVAVVVSPMLLGAIWTVNLLSGRISSLSLVCMFRLQFL